MDTNDIGQPGLCTRHDGPSYLGARRVDPGWVDLQTDDALRRALTGRWNPGRQADYFSHVLTGEARAAALRRISAHEDDVDLWRASVRCGRRIVSTIVLCPERVIHERPGYVPHPDYRALAGVTS